MQALRIAIVTGHPTDAEIAAITAALERHLAASVPAPTATSRWTRAARLESSGHPPIDQPGRFPR